MSNQPPPARPWFRLASIARSAPPQPPAPTPEPTPAPPRTAAVRPAFRPTGQAAEGATPAGGVGSVPTSPVTGGRVSQPSSPSQVRTAANGGVQITPPKTITTGSLPSSPVRPVQTTASLHNSPVKPVATTTSVPTSPAKPVAKTGSLPTSPAKPVTSSLPTSPAKTITSSPTRKIASPVPTRVGGPLPSPSLVQSPKIKPPTAPPPSPLTLPVSQFKVQSEMDPKIPPEAEQKTILVQSKAEKPKHERLHPDHGETHKHGFPVIGKKEPLSKDDISKKYASDSDDSGMRVITIAGENKGAFMELIQSPHKNGSGRRVGEPKRNNLSRMGSDRSDYQSYSSSSDEGDRKMKDMKNNSSKTMPMSAFMNSNVQGINNSIMFNSSCTHHDPGVHLSLHKKPVPGGGFHVKERTNGYNS